MPSYIVRENWDTRRVVKYSGGICTFVFLVVIFTLFLGNPLLWWLWFFLLIPVGGWVEASRPVQYVETYERMGEEPRSPRAGRDTPEGIEMRELKF